MSKKILMIVTSNDRMGDSRKPTGVWAEELAVPYYHFVDAGMDVTLASPKGGRAPLDPGSVKPAGQNSPAVERLLADADAQAKIANTHAATTLDGADYDAVFLPGGHGTMWDLPTDVGVVRAVETAFAANRTVAAVCHGPAGLVNAKRPDGKSIVFGKRVNAFTDAEESAVGLTGVVPFALETTLRSLGGVFESAALWQSHAVRDGNLVTGQNPASSESVARLTLESLQAAPNRVAA
jgi:putative intracellular protease/amidase